MGSLKINSISQLVNGDFIIEIMIAGVIVMSIIGFGIYMNNLPVVIVKDENKHKNGNQYGNGNGNITENFQNESSNNNDGDNSPVIDLSAERDKLVKMLQTADINAHDDPSNSKRGQLRVGLETLISKIDEAIMMGGRYQSIDAVQEIVAYRE